MLVLVENAYIEGLHYLTGLLIQRKGGAQGFSVVPARRAGTGPTSILETARILWPKCPGPVLENPRDRSAAHPRCIAQQ